MDKFLYNYLNQDSQSGVPGPEASASPGVQILGLHPSPNELETLGMHLVSVLSSSCLLPNI